MIEGQDIRETRDTKLASMLTRYGMHVMVATLGILLGVYLVTFPIFFIAVTTSLIPKPLNQIIDRIVGEPVFPLPILTGFIAGYSINRRFRDWSAMWVWILPAVCLAYSIATWHGHLYSGLSYWKDVWNTFFGTDCSGSECLYEWLVTSPFYTAVAYSIGAFFGYRKGLRDPGEVKRRTLLPRAWASRVIRFFGVANFLFAIVGLVGFVVATPGYFAGTYKNWSSALPAPYVNQALLIMIGINIIFLALLALAGVRLLQLQAGAVTICNFLFPAEVVYSIGVAFVWWLGLPESVKISIAVASQAIGVGNMGIALQFFTAYPLVGLVALNLARRKLTRAEPSSR